MKATFISRDGPPLLLAAAYFLGMPLRIKEALNPYRRTSLPPSKIPNGFTTEGGNANVSGTADGIERDPSRLWTTDGYLNIGLSIDTPRRAISLEFVNNQDSLASNPAGAGLDIRFGRLLGLTRHLQVGISAGWLVITSHGDVSLKGNSPYGMITAVWPRRPTFPDVRQTMEGTVADEAGRCQRIDGPSLIGNRTFALIGVDLAPHAELSDGWAGYKVNDRLSVAPLRQMRLMLNASGINPRDTDNGGRTAALNLSWGREFPHCSLLITQYESAMQNTTSIQKFSSGNRHPGRSQADGVFP